MKKIFAALIAAVLVISSVATVFATENPTFVLGKAAFESEGDSAVMTIKAENFSAVSIIQFTVLYDSTKIELQGVSDNMLENVAKNGFSGATVSCIEPGKINVVWEVENNVSLDEVILEFEFVSIAEGSFIEGLGISSDEDEEIYVKYDIRKENGELDRYEDIEVDIVEEAIGFNISGTVISYLDENEKTTIALYEEGNAEPSYSTYVTGNNTEYAIVGVAPGTYTIEVSKANHATYTEELIVEDSDINKNFKIYQYGDINGDGSVKANDKTVLARYLAHWTGYETLDVYDAVADLNGDGTIKANDKTVLARYLAHWTGYETLPRK